MDEFVHEKTGLEFIRIPAGKFVMGDDHSWNDDEKPAHQVYMDEYWLGKTVLTQRVWQRIMGTMPWRGKNYVKEGENYPAVYISWEDCREFCEKTGLCLPSEAQWEKAYRGGTRSAYYWGDKMDGAYAWYGDNAWNAGEKYAHEVAQKKCNAYGLYDMAGNVFEWCADWYCYDYYKESPGENPKGHGDGPCRVRRGGCFQREAVRCRAAFRGSHPPGARDCNIGVRLCAVDLRFCSK